VIYSNYFTPKHNKTLIIDLEMKNRKVFINLFVKKIFSMKIFSFIFVFC